MKQYDEIEEILQNEFYLKPAFEPIEKIKFYDFWRLYYTAFSRPQNLLVLTAREVEGKGKSPSKYFESVYNNLIDWKDETFDSTKLTLEKVKPVNVKHQFSFTSHIL